LSEKKFRILPSLVVAGRDARHAGGWGRSWEKPPGGRRVMRRLAAVNKVRFARPQRSRSRPSYRECLRVPVPIWRQSWANETAFCPTRRCTRPRHRHVLDGRLHKYTCTPCAGNRAMPHRARPVRRDLAATAVPLHRQGTSPATASSPHAAPATPK
jgi:hypothetical protein